MEYGESKARAMPVGKDDERSRLKPIALYARLGLRRAQRLARKLPADDLTWWELREEERNLVDRLATGELSSKADIATQDFGFGMWRTNDYGGRQGELAVPALHFMNYVLDER